MRYSISIVALSLATFGLALPSPLFSTSNSATPRIGDVIPESYIVVLKPEVDEDLFETHAAQVQSINARRLRRRNDPTIGVKLKLKISGFSGYTANFLPETIAEIRNLPEVDFVEEDTVVGINAVTQQNAPWGLSRTSTKANGFNGTTIPQAKGKTGPYTYPDSAGEGTTVYIVDTGVNIKHVEFEGRAVWGMTANPSDRDDDFQGHGTHVAGTVAGKTFGVAKKANIVAVKVLGDNGFGSTASVITGVEWVARNATDKKVAIANMSLGGGLSTALNRAVEAAIASGVTFVVAAGNDNAPAANYSPANVPSAVTVGATAIDDSRASYSNFGPEIDIFAPGSNITSAWIGNSTANNTISGTSMAAPHVAGVAALLGGLGVKDIAAELVKLGTKNVVKDPKGSVNLLLFNSASGTGINGTAYAV